MDKISSTNVDTIRFSLTETDGSKCSEETLSNRKWIIDSLKSINGTVLPINYTEAFYNSLFRYPEDQSVAWISFEKRNEEDKDKGEPIGAIILKPDKEAGLISVLTFAVLSKHRSKGIGKVLIEKAFEECRKRTEYSGGTETTTAKDKFIWKEMEVHVQKDNEGAIRFYKTYGFRQKKGKSEERNYYRRVSYGSTTAIVLYKNVVSNNSSEPAKKKRKKTT